MNGPYAIFAAILLGNIAWKCLGGAAGLRFLATSRVRKEVTVFGVNT